MPRTIARLAVPATLALALAACGEAEETTYEADAEVVGSDDVELQMSDAEDDAVPVELPETEMTNVPAGEVPEDMEGGMEAEAE